MRFPYNNASNGAEYTPLIFECQYLVAIFFFNAIDCICKTEHNKQITAADRFFPHTALPLVLIAANVSRGRPRTPKR